VTIDLVCWDFGDTLVDERFMRLAPDGVPQWGAVYDEVLAERPDWVASWDLGRGSINDLVGPLAARLPMTEIQIVRHLRLVWERITWFPDAEHWVDRLAGRVDQAVATVNPHEFSGIARACGLDVRIPMIVTSADLATTSKVVMAEHARAVLGLSPGLSTTVLVDNRADNVQEFTSAGGRAVRYQPDSGCLDELGTMIG
jgi:FMN phosphatase YigB (HAD superfamily)